MSKLTELGKETKRIQEELKKTAQSQVVPAIRETFEELQRSIPGLTKARWVQYTPYFNDGDECTFGVHESTFQFSDPAIKGNYAYDDDDDGSFYEGYGLDKILNKEQYEALKRFSSDLYTIKPLLKDAFGDHTRILVTSTGIETEEYEHD